MISGNPHYAATMNSAYHFCATIILTVQHFNQTTMTIDQCTSSAHHPFSIPTIVLRVIDAIVPLIGVLCFRVPREM